jgi:hypothetical protein
MCRCKVTNLAKYKVALAMLHFATLALRKDVGMTDSFSSLQLEQDAPATPDATAASKVVNAVAIKQYSGFKGRCSRNRTLAGRSSALARLPRRRLLASKVRKHQFSRILLMATELPREHYQRSLRKLLSGTRAI